MAENLDIDDRLAVRTPMQWMPNETAGFSTAPADALCRPLPTDERFAPAIVNVQTQRTDPDSLLNWFERIIRLRKEIPEIGWGRCTILEGGPAAALVLRYDWEGRTVVTAHNLGRRKVTAAVQLEDVPAGSCLRDELEAGDVVVNVRNGRARLTLAAYDHRWYRLVVPS